VRENLAFTLGHPAVDTVFTVAGNSIVPLSAIIWCQTSKVGEKKVLS
jgi:hypothetical protein